MIIVQSFKVNVGFIPLNTVATVLHGFSTGQPRSSSNYVILPIGAYGIQFLRLIRASYLLDRMGSFSPASAPYGILTILMEDEKLRLNPVIIGSHSWYSAQQKSNCYTRLLEMRSYIQFEFCIWTMEIKLVLGMLYIPNMLMLVVMLKWKFKLVLIGFWSVTNVSWVSKGLISVESLVVKWNCTSHPFWKVEVHNLITATLMKGNIFWKSLQSLAKDSNYILILMGLLKHPSSSFCCSRELYFGSEETLGRVVGIKKVLVQVHGGEIFCAGISIHRSFLTLSLSTRALPPGVPDIFATFWESPSSFVFDRGKFVLHHVWGLWYQSKKYDNWADFRIHIEAVLKRADQVSAVFHMEEDRDHETHALASRGVAPHMQIYKVVISGETRTITKSKLTSTTCTSDYQAVQYGDCGPVYHGKTSKRDFCFLAGFMGRSTTLCDHFSSHGSSLWITWLIVDMSKVLMGNLINITASWLLHSTADFLILTPILLTHVLEDKDALKGSVMSCIRSGGECPYSIVVSS
ncbi:uncharacterized protein LOC113348789 [Papaver somniferum]|uniref:uncharacterized protein LOC113348789 n=1 Tax=Papaver somniferum TaxID=3469 RepID=UPI000E705F2F|nr:uncharacterized protein LOC113348789 [Papaver somniferum]